MLLQRLREAERESQYQEYAQREGDIIGTDNRALQAAVSPLLWRARLTVAPRGRIAQSKLPGSGRE